MMKHFISISMALGALFLFNSEPVHGVRIMDDDWRPARSVETQEALEKKLFETIALPRVNGGRVAFTIDRTRQMVKLEELQSNDSLIDRAIETQVEELLALVPEDLREDLRTRWERKDWVSFSKRGEHTIVSRPLGEVVVHSRKEFRLYLDERLKALPTLQKLIQMIAITHVVAPRVMILETEGVAFYQRTHDALEAITLGAGYWTLTQWLQLVQVEKPLLSEIKSSPLQLSAIRSLLSEIGEVVRSEPVETLNRYIKVHHPEALKNGQMKAFFQAWLNESVIASSASGLIAKKESVQQESEPREAKIIPFRPRIKKVDGSTCATALGTDTP
jgi:hypothetical protein